MRISGLVLLLILMFWTQDSLSGQLGNHVPITGVPFEKLKVHHVERAVNTCLATGDPGRGVHSMLQELGVQAFGEEFPATYGRGWIKTRRENEGWSGKHIQYYTIGAGRQAYAHADTYYNGYFVEADTASAGQHARVRRAVPGYRREVAEDTAREIAFWSDRETGRAHFVVLEFEKTIPEFSQSGAPLRGPHVRWPDAFRSRSLTLPEGVPFPTVYFYSIVKPGEEPEDYLLIDLPSPALRRARLVSAESGEESDLVVDLDAYAGCVQSELRRQVRALD